MLILNRAELAAENGGGTARVRVRVRDGSNPDTLTCRSELGRVSRVAYGYFLRGSRSAIICSVRLIEATVESDPMERYMMMTTMRTSHFSYSFEGMYGRRCLCTNAKATRDAKKADATCSCTGVVVRGGQRGEVARWHQYSLQMTGTTHLLRILLIRPDYWAEKGSNGPAIAALVQLLMIGGP